MFHKGGFSHYGKYRSHPSDNPLLHNQIDFLHGGGSPALSQYTEDKALASQEKGMKDQLAIAAKQEEIKLMQLRQDQARKEIEDLEAKRRTPQLMTLDNVPGDKLLAKPVEELVSHDQPMEIQTEEPVTNKKLYYTEVLKKHP
jgi:hypothetical protein